ncbi:7674_t:CDS:2 [Rhizophagus irregularis]|nr:7674_t:CDS:2 [Rhizophagus irregularis]
MPEENISSNIPLTPLETRLEVNFLSDEENYNQLTDSDFTTRPSPTSTITVRAISPTNAKYTTFSVK